MSDPYQPQYQQPMPPQNGQYPQPGQPVHPQQPFPQPFQQPSPQPFQQPFPQPFQRPPKDRRVLIVSLIAVVVVLVGFAGAVAIAYNLTRDDEPPAVASTANGAGSGEKRLRLTAPDSIGAWKKASSQETAGKLSAATSAGAIDEPFAAQYDNAGATASVWGGTGETIGYDTVPQVFQAFAKAALSVNPGTAGTAGPVDPGMIGGEARCSAIVSSTGTATVCLWHAQQVALAFLFAGTEPDTAGPHVKTMLTGLLTMS